MEPPERGLYYCTRRVCPKPLTLARNTATIAWPFLWNPNPNLGVTMRTALCLPVFASVGLLVTGVVGCGGGSGNSAAKGGVAGAGGVAGSSGAGGMSSAGGTVGGNGTPAVRAAARSAHRLPPAPGRSRLAAAIPPEPGISCPHVSTAIWFPLSMRRSPQTIRVAVARSLHLA